MSFICNECHHIFDDGEELRWVESHGEPYSGCPICGGSYTEAQHCVHCYGDFLEDDLTCGWCDECLKEMVTYDNFWAFLKDTGLVAEFMFVKLWESSIPETISVNLETMMEQEYKSIANYEKRFHEDDFIKLCESYIFDDKNPWGNKYDFADWLTANKKGVKA